MKNPKLLLSILLLFAMLSTPLTNETEIPVVTAIYPSADTIPANLLRMYLHFSKPMRITGNLEQIKLLDENNNEVVGAIFNNVYELWDDQQQQLTLIFDPARVKTGLVAHQQMGRALQSGKHYTLIV